MCVYIYPYIYTYIPIYTYMIYTHMIYTHYIYIYNLPIKFDILCSLLSPPNPVFALQCCKEQRISPLPM